MKLIIFVIPWCNFLVDTASPSPYYHHPHVFTAPRRSSDADESVPMKDDSFFGYSVAYEPVSKKFIIGAPKADKIGKVFECDITKQNNTCKDIKPDIKFNQETEARDGYWLGATIQAGKSFYVVCAPRSSTDEKSWKGTAGKCYVRHTATSNHKWPSMLTMDKTDRKIKIPGQNLTHDPQLQDSLGWTMSIFNNSVLMGGPAIRSGRAALYRNLKSRPSIKLGLMQKPTRSYMNFGYCVHISKKMTSKYLVSSTFGEVGNGKIYAYTFEKEDEGSIIAKDDQNVGALYGASLCTIIIKKEKKIIDILLLAGSPAYRDPGTSSYDIGMVYVYSISNRKVFSQIRGNQNGGYFGNTMAKLDDLNGDSISELAVSAPYEDGGRGAVYIYSGDTLLQKQPLLLQKIQPEGFRYLGLSLTAMPNLDDNGCSGLGIGAPGSGNALVLHCMASVVVKLSVEIPELQNRHESKLAQVNETHFQFTWCLNIESKKKTKSIALDFKVTVTVEHQDAKLLDVEGRPRDDHSTYEVFLNDSIRCTDSRVYLPINGFYEKPLYITVTAEQKFNDEADFDPARVVLSELSTLTESKTVWAADCRDRSHCEPRLNATAVMTVGKNYVIGSTAEEALKIEVSNSGETAYNLCVSVRVRGVRVKLAAECEQDNAHDEWRCPAPGPLRRGQPWKLKDIILEMASLNSTVKEVSYEIKVLIHCSKVSETERGNTSLRNDVQGVTVRGIDNFEGQVNVKDNIMKRLVHKYTITNNGTTKWANLKFILTIPRNKYTSNDLTIRYGDSTQPRNCTVRVTTNSTQADCIIEKLSKGEIISIFLTSTIITKELENGNVTFETTLALDLSGDMKIESVRTLIQVEKLGVPVWIIVTAAVIGLLLLLLISFIMHETGILKRKKRERLNQLRTSVRRQTLRLSTAEAFQVTDLKDHLVDGDFTVEEEEFCEIIDLDKLEGN